MNTLPALPPVVYLAGRYMTSLDMFMAKVRDVLSSTRRNALMEQEHLLALYRDGVLLDWLRTLSPTDHRAGSMHSSMEKMMQQTMTDTEAKKALGNLFGAKEARVTALRFDEYLELLPECMVRINRKSFKQSIDDEIQVGNVDVRFIVVTLSFRVLKVANDVIPVAVGQEIENIALHIKGKIYSLEFKVVLSNIEKFAINITSNNISIHTLKVIGRWVDLGFGVKWATCNIGAGFPWERGDIIQWGMIGNILDRDKWNRNYYRDMNKWRNMFERELDIGGNPKKDYATAKKGKEWRMPTVTHFKQLFDMCIKEECEIQGVKCYKLISRINNAFLIIPIEQSVVWTSNSKDVFESYAANVGSSRYLYNMMWTTSLPVRPIYIG